MVIDTVEISPITEEEAKEIFLDAYDTALAKEKRLIKKSIYEETYLNAQASYMALLNYYLCEKTELGEYQEMLDSHIFEFPYDEESAVRNYGACGRNNISIINNLFVERLSEKDLRLLNKNVEGSVLNITESLMEMVERTYQEVITVRYEESDAAFSVIYTMGALYTEEAPNKALVFEIRYNPVYDEVGNIKSTAYEAEKQKIAEMLAELMESEMENAIGTEVTVFIRN